MLHVWTLILFKHTKIASPILGVLCIATLSEGQDVFFRGTPGFQSVVKPSTQSQPQ